MGLSKQIEELIEQHTRFHPDTGKPGELLPAYAWPGGYPIYYIDKGGAVLCPACAEEEIREWQDAPEDEKDYYEDDLPIAADVNYEDPELWCEGCNERIESAYAEDD